jgi:hypothetical protein
MKRKIVVLVICLAAMFPTAFGQKVKLEIVRMPVSLPAADETYGKDKRFKIILPEEISALAKNTNKTVAGGFFGELHMLGPIPAKSVNEKKGETPDIVFEIVSPGIQNLKIGLAYPVSIAEKRESFDKIIPASKGYVANITFNFPLKLEIKDGNGNIKRTITFADETDKFYAVYHNNFFKERVVGDKALEFPPVAFPTKQDLDASIDIFGTDALNLRTAKNKLEQLFDDCMSTIRMCYGENSRLNMRFAFVCYKLTEWDNPAKTELSEAVEKMKTAFASTYDINAQQTFTQSLSPVIAVYEKYLAEYGEQFKPIKKLCLHNVILSYYFLGDYENVAKHYYSYYKEFGSVESYLSDRPAPEMYIYSQLKKSADLHFPENLISSIENKINKSQRDEQVEVRNQKQAEIDSINLERTPYGGGLIVDVNDKEYDGTVKLYLFGEPQEGGIVNIGPETPIKLYDRYDEKKLVRSFKIKDVKKVIVNNSLYVPIKIGSGLLASTIMMKLVYEKGNFQLYYDIRWSSYSVRRIGQDKIYDINDILKEKKSADEFYKSCPSLKDKQLKVENVDDKDAAGILEAMKSIIDQIETICK